MVADEVLKTMKPVHAALAELQGNNAVIARLAAALAQPTNIKAAKPVKIRTPKSDASAPITAPRRGPGRPRKAIIAAPTTPTSMVPPTKGSQVPKAAGGKQICAIIDCGGVSRTKGYCAAHYQKFRMLDRTGRLPSDWVANAEPGTVMNVELPRGRPAKSGHEARN